MKIVVQYLGFDLLMNIHSNIYKHFITYGCMSEIDIESIIVKSLKGTIYENYINKDNRILKYVDYDQNKDWILTNLIDNMVFKIEDDDWKIKINMEEMK